MKRMAKRLALNIWMILVTPGQGRKPSTIVLSVAEQNEVLLYSWTESAFTVKSSYADNTENTGYIVVSVDDLGLVQIVNVTRVTPNVRNVTHFMVRVNAQDIGQTTFKVQLWVLQGNQHRLIEETEEIQLKVINKPQSRHLSEPAGRGFSTLLVILILPVILLNKCAFGCKIEVETLRILWQKPLPVIVGAAVQFFLMPFWGFLLTHILELPQALSFGFIMTCTCPGGGGGYLYALLLEGDITLAISMTCTSTMLAVVMMPINSFMYSRTLGLSGSLHIPFLKMMAALLSIATPIAVGIIIKHKAPKGAEYLERIIRPLSSLIIVVGIYLGFQMGSQFLKEVHLDLLLIGVFIPAFGLFIGYCFSAIIFKLPVPVCKTIAIESGVQNSFISLAIIQLSFPQPEADVISACPFLVGLSAAGEMLLILLVYNARRKKGVRLDSAKTF